MMGIMEMAEVVVKWKHYRTSVYRFYTVPDKVEGEAKFRERMKLLQLYIKACMEKHSLEMIPAITHLGNETEGMLTLQILAAGYDLTEGIDYTIEQNGENKDSTE